MVKEPEDHSNFLYWLTFFIICALIGTFVFNKLAFAETSRVLVVPAPAARSSAPTTTLSSSGQPYVAYPSQSANGPVTTITPSSAPIHSYPAPSTYGPATVIVPNELPTFVWPGVGE